MVTIRAYSQEVKPFVPSEKAVTHTGQEWAAGDRRQARFDSYGRNKMVNEQFSINLIKEAPPISVKGSVAVCDGGTDPALGHPRIFINVDQPGNHSCNYCGLRYFKEPVKH